MTEDDGYFWCIADCHYCSEAVYWSHTLFDWAHVCITECDYPLATLIMEELW